MRQHRTTSARPAAPGGQLEFWPAAAVAPRVGGLLTGGDHAELNEPFLFEAVPGVWVVVKWSLTPKLATDGWWFPFWWNGPGSRRWTGSHGEEPEGTARFPSAEAAAEAVAAEAEAGSLGSAELRRRQ